MIAVGYGMIDRSRAFWVREVTPHSSLAWKP